MRNIFIDFVESLKLKENAFGLEVTETAELGNTSQASKSLQNLKDKGIEIVNDIKGVGKNFSGPL